MSHNKIHNESYPLVHDSVETQERKKQTDKKYSTFKLSFQYPVILCYVDKNCNDALQLF